MPLDKLSPGLGPQLDQNMSFHRNTIWVAWKLALPIHTQGCVLGLNTPLRQQK